MKFDGRAEKHLGESVTVAFATGKHANPFENVILTEQETAEETAEFGLGFAAANAGQVVENRRVDV